MRGIVYKIVCKVSDDVYVGSTLKSMTHRWNSHMGQFRDWKQGKRNDCTSIFPYFDKYGVDNFDMILIREYEVGGKRELEKYEDWWIQELECVNKNRAFVTPEERQAYRKNYYQENRERIVEHRKNFYRDNRELVLERDRQYYQNNRDATRKSQKRYYQSNRERLIEQSKKYNEENKEKVREQARKKIECECGAVVCKGDIARHRKSKKHKLQIVPVYYTRCLTELLDTAEII